MKHQIKRLWAVVAVVIAVAGPARAAEKPAGSDQALGQVFESLGRSALGNGNPSAFDYRRSAVLFDAARRCDPTEPRYPRLAADAIKKGVNDAQRLIEEINAFRQLRPDDRGSQLELIDVYLSQMQTVDQQIAYCRDILAREAVPAEVRAAVAMRYAAALSQKGREQEAGAVVEQALKLDPLNWAGLLWRFDQARDTATPAQRMSLLVGLVRSNPRDLPTLGQISQELARQGLAEEAAGWYEIACRASLMSGAAPPLAEWMSQKILAGKAADASGFLDTVLAGNPTNFDALLLRSLLERRTNANAADALLARARSALINALQGARTRLGVKGAATRPAGEAFDAVPDLAGDAAVYPQAAAGARDLYLQRVADLAWFEAYFDSHPEDAEKLLNHYLSLAPKGPDTDQFAARVQGWAFLRQGKAAEARVKLSAAADKDALAALGLVQLEKDKDKAKAEAQKLLARERLGIIAVVIHEAVRGTGAAPAPGPDAAAVRVALSALPRAWISILAQPNRFYALRGEPLKVTHVYGEPMLVRVTVQNTSEHDLTVGDHGAIDPRLLFNAQMSGGVNKVLFGVAVEGLTGQLVLRPRQSITQVMRMDQGSLGDDLLSYPIPAIAINGQVVSNAVPVGTGQWIPGSAGYGAQFSRLMERRPFPASEAAMGRLPADLKAATGADKIRLVEFMTPLTMKMMEPAAEPAMQKAGSAYLDALRTASQDPDPAIRAYGAFAYASACPPVLAESAVKRMLEPGTPWQERVLGLLCVNRLPEDQRKAAAATAARDADPTVKELGAALQAALSVPPATRPAAAP